MIKKTGIKFNSKLYKVVFLGNVRNDNFTGGYAFYILKGTEKPIGVVHVLFQWILSSAWNKSRFVIENQYQEKLLPFVIQILPYIIIPEDLQFKEPEDQYFNIIFTFDKNDSYDVKEKTLYVKGTDTPEELVISKVYDDDLSDNVIAQQILQFFYEHQKDIQGGITPKELEQYLFIESEQLAQNMSYLEARKYLFPQATKDHGFSYTLRSEGRAEYEKMLQSVPMANIHYENVQGDKITASGNNSTIYNKSDITIIDKQFDNLEQYIIENYNESDKSEAVKEIKELKKIAKQPEKKKELQSGIAQLVKRYEKHKEIYNFILFIVLPTFHKIIAGPVE